MRPNTCRFGFAGAAGVPASTAAPPPPRVALTASSRRSASFTSMDSCERFARSIAYAMNAST